MTWTGYRVAGRSHQNCQASGICGRGKGDSRPPGAQAYPARGGPTRSFQRWAPTPAAANAPNPLPESRRGRNWTSLIFTRCRSSSPRHPQQQLSPLFHPHLRPLGVARKLLCPADSGSSQRCLRPWEELTGHYARPIPEAHRGSFGPWEQLTGYYARPITKAQSKRTTRRGAQGSQAAVVNVCCIRIIVSLL